LAIGARLAYSGVSKDWHKSDLSVGRRSDFVSGDAFLGNYGDLLVGYRIDQGKRAITLIGDQECALRGLCKCEAVGEEHESSREERQFHGCKGW
jgi:hypothetical protein